MGVGAHKCLARPPHILVIITRVVAGLVLAAHLTESVVGLRLVQGAKLVLLLRNDTHTPSAGLWPFTS
ncbi:hypothetical protein HYQ46_001895 [Verticillium longisporum]|nr:hypothetical protein HYQ46_001895 [Verticillium longisporum]